MQTVQWVLRREGDESVARSVKKQKSLPYALLFSSSFSRLSVMEFTFIPGRSEYMVLDIYVHVHTCICSLFCVIYSHGRIYMSTYRHSHFLLDFFLCFDKEDTIRFSLSFCGGQLSWCLSFVSFPFLVSLFFLPHAFLRRCTCTDTQHV